MHEHAHMLKRAVLLLSLVAAVVVVVLSSCRVKYQQDEKMGPRHTFIAIITNTFGVLALLSASESFVLLGGGRLRANGIGDVGVSCSRHSSTRPWLLGAAAEADGKDPAVPLVKTEEPPVVSDLREAGADTYRQHWTHASSMHQ